MSIYSLDFYVYAYLRSDGTPYYIGKGKGNRAWDKNHNVPLPKQRERIVIVSENLTELWSLALERRLIKWYGRKDNNTGILRNRTDGGEGSTGMSEESRKKISNSMLGNQRGKGKTFVHTEEAKRKQSEAKKRNPQRYWLGKKRPETGRKVSESLKGNIPWNKGIPQTVEVKKKLSESVKNIPPVTCPHCSKVGHISLMKRYHFDNCKMLNLNIQETYNTEVI